MNNLICTILVVLSTAIALNSQITQTANDFVVPYTGKFRPSSNVGFFPPFSELELADLAAGNEALNVPGVGVKAFRPSLSEFFMEEYGYDFFEENFDHYESIGLKENTVIVGFPQEAHQDPAFYCSGIRSELFANLYTPIWDNGENGTPVNDDNYFALYLYKMVSNYKDHVKFWEIWNEPGFDYSGAHGWKDPGQPGNWWDNNPDPCDYKLRAPIFHYIRTLRISYEIIHTVDPEGYVTVSGVGYPSFLDAILRNTDNPAGGGVTAEYPNKGGAYFDVVGFHAYPHFDGSLKAWNIDAAAFDYFRHSDAAADGIKNVQDDLQVVLDTHGYDGGTYPEKHWIVTECNIPRKPVEEYIGGDEVQRNFLIKAYIESVKSNFLQLHVYKLAEERVYDEVVDEFEAMGLYKKLEYNNLYFQEPTEQGIGYKTTSDLLFGKDYDPAKTAALQLPDNINGAAFYDEYQNYTYALWAKTTIDESEEANAVYNFPAGLGLNNLLKREWDFCQTSDAEMVSSQGIQLTGTPIFLTDQIFEASVAEGCAPVTIAYQSNSFPGATNYTWNFEGGTPTTSTSLAPTVTYNASGGFDVSLEIRNASGDIITAQTGSMNVGTEPTVGFSPAISGPIVVFNNTTGPNTQFFQWDFGDGFTSTDANPMHIYATSGSYLVELTVGNDCGIVSYSETITAEVPADPALTTTANNFIPPYDQPFRPGCNLGIYGEQWTDEGLADLAAGNTTEDVKGAGIKALRPFLPEDFLERWGYSLRLPTFQHYQNIGLEDNTAIVGFPSEEHQEQIFYCQSYQSELFSGIYDDIWDNGENGTPVNDDNYYALYLYKTALIYKDYVKFWEIWNEPGFDYTGERGWLFPGMPGNWWENNPDPCHYKLRAPIFHMVRLLRISYEVIKSVDPDAMITFSGIGYPSFLDAVLRNSDNPDDGSVSGNYPFKGGAYFDVVGFHSYPHFDGSLRYWDGDLGTFVYERHSDAAAKGILKTQDSFNEVLANYGYDGSSYPEKHWIITECNIPRKPFSGSLGGNDPQVNYVIKAYVESVRSGILQLHMYKIGEETDYWTAGDEFDLMGLYGRLDNINPGFAYINDEGIAMKTTSDQLYGTSYDEAKTMQMNLPDDIDGAAFVDVNGDYTYVLWAKTSIDNSEAGNATYSFPTEMGITQLYKKLWNYSNTEWHEVVNGMDLALTAKPIFLSETLATQPAPLALFEADTEEGCPPFNVSFENLSENGDAYLWSFPGGNPATSTEENPTVVYNSPGTFNASLKVFNTVGEHVSTELNYIFSESLPQSDFDFAVTGSDVTFSNNAFNATNYLWDFGDGYTSIGHHPDHSYFENGDFTVSLAAINECGSVTSTQIVTIGAPPVADFKSAFNNACGIFTVYFQDDSQSSPTSWLWNFPGGSPAVSTAQNVLVTYTTPGAYDVTLQVSNALGTDEATSFNHIVSEVFPQAGFSATVEGVTGTFNNTSTEFAEYLWDFGDGTSSMEMEPVHNFPGAGSFEVLLTVTNTCGEISTSESLVTTVQTPPNVDFSADVISGCAPLTVQYQSLASPNTSNWAWTFPDGIPASSENQNPSITYDEPGNYTVTLQVSNAVGSDTETRIAYIEVLEVPVAEFDYTVSGTTVTFQNLSANATGFDWNFNDGTNSSEENPVHTFTEVGDYTVWLTADNGCSTSLISAQVVIESAPQAAFSFDATTGCAPFLVTYQDNSGGNVSSWFWSFPGGTPASSNQPNPSVSYFAAGTYSATLLVGNTIGDSELTQANIIVVDAEPVAAFTTSHDEFTVSFVNEVDNADSYAWDFGDGNTSTLPNPTHIYTTEGFYNVSLSVSNACGTNVTTAEIEISSLPVATIGANAVSGCQGLEVQFSDLSEGQVETWEWIFPGGTPATSTMENPMVSYATSGQYLVRLIATNAVGSDTISLENYIEILPDPVVDFTYEQSGNIISLSSSIENENSFIWDFGDGGLSTNPNPIYEFSELGTYEVSLNASNDCNEVIASQTVEVTLVFQAAFSADVIQGCAPLTVQFFDNTVPTATEWEWVFEGGDTPTATEQNPVVVYNEPGIYPVMLTSTDGLSTAMMVTPGFIHVLEPVSSAFELTMSGTEVEFVNNSEYATEYSWDFGDGNINTEENPIHTYAQAGTYTVILTATNECGSVTSTQDITVFDFPVAAFTSDANVGCIPFAVQFTDMSSNDITAWEWIFPGGEPNFSSEQNPLVTYSEPGIYPVTLIATNPIGTATFEATDYININSIPVPAFETSINSVMANFANNSTNADSYVWDFGDGSAVSTEENPFHFYAIAGEYTVSLMATNECGTETITETIAIVIAPNAFFTADITNGCAPLTVQFIDQSSGGTTSWNWSFQGGTPATSTEQFPTVTYTETGSYNVTLMAANSAGSIAHVQNNYITVDELPQAGFGFEMTQYTVSFLNGSNNGTTYFWDFGDGNTSMLPNPTHVFGSDGNYIVNLTTTNDCGESIFQDTVVILTFPSANFTSNITDSCVPLIVEFSNMSSGNTDSLFWTFEGGTPETSVEENPVVSFDTIGTYSVSLVASNALGSDTTIFQDYIVTDDVPSADFSFNVNENSVFFVNNSEEAVNYYWSFGDGQTSAAEDPFYIYPVSGMYEVLLIAENNCGFDTIAQTINIIISGLANQDVIEKVTILPNPNTGKFTLIYEDSKTNSLQLDIINILGQQVFSKKYANVQNSLIDQFDLQQLPKGTYLLRLMAGKRQKCMKLILQ